MLCDPPTPPRAGGGPPLLITATLQPRQLEAPFQHQLPQVSQQKKRAWEECALALFLFKILKICLFETEREHRLGQGGG